MTKNNGWAEIQDYHFLEPFGFHVIINHFTGEPELWDTFATKQEAKEEAFLWNNGLWGKGFTYSAEWLRLNTTDDKDN